MNKRTVERIPERKKNTVRELVDLIDKNRTILIASVKNLPASQFQEIGKKLRGKAIVKIPKKNLLIRAIDESGNEELKKIKEKIQDSTAILFSNLDSFELSSELLESKSPAKAKIGQEAPKDIEVEAGPTDLVAGPAISELGALGIKIQMDKGKINIKEPKIIVKEGEKISENAASIMNKLDIKPFSVGFIPLSSFDTEENKLYVEINIDKEGTLQNIRELFAKALAFAVELAYSSKDTIGFLIGKARKHEIALNNLVKEEVKKEKPGKNTQSPEENSVEENKNRPSEVDLEENK